MKISNLKSWIFIAAGVLLFSAKLFAAMDDQDKKDATAKKAPLPMVASKEKPSLRTDVLEPVVVTGSKRERTLSNSPVKTEHVNKEVIEKNHLSDLSQVLDNIPGVTLQNLTGRLGRAPVVQGLSDEQVLVLIDGIPQLQVSSSGYDLTQISVGDIEDVEVIKGGASSLYGSQAIGGVINVITKKPKDKTEYFLDFKNIYVPEEQIESIRTLPNVINGSVSGRIAEGLNYKLTLGHRRQGAIDLDESTLAQDMGETLRYNVSGRLSKRISQQHSISLDALYIDETLKLSLTQPTSGGYIPVNNETGTTTQSYTLGHNLSFASGSNLKTTLFYSQVSDQMILNDDPSTSYFENVKNADLNTILAETQYDASWFNGQETTLGLQYRYQFLDQQNITSSSSGVVSNTEVDQKSLWSVESYAQHSIRLNDFEITPGIRGQYDSDFGSQASPSVNMIYSPKIFSDIKSNIRSSVGTGYRIPSLKERFFLMDHRNIAGYIIEGASDLNPERSVSYQLGLELIKRQKFSFHINGFVNNVNDMIGVVQNTEPDGTMVFGYENLHQVQSRGVEFSTSVTPFKKWTLEQDLTLSRTQNINQNYEVPLRPRTLYKLRAYFNATSKMMLAGLFRFQSDEYLDIANNTISPSYSVFDLKVNYKYDRQVNLYAGIDNLFDVTRNPARDGEMMFFDNRPIVGRQFYIGLNYRDL